MFVCWVSANSTLNVYNDANEFSDDKMSEFVDICWSDVDRVPHVCEDKLHPLLQKSPMTSGPLRVAYARPFVVVFGTKTADVAMLAAIKDFAVYFANSHTSLLLLCAFTRSDVEYLVF